MQSFSDCPALKVKKLSANARAPERASAGAAGYDLYSAQEAVVRPGTREMLRTDLSIQIPPGHYGRIAPRSGVAWKFGIDIGAGVVDEDYRGALGILFVNNGINDYTVKVGDRVAQLLLERISTPEVLVVEELDASARGIAGFGSTGVNEMKPHATTPPQAENVD